MGPKLRARTANPLASTDSLGKCETKTAFSASIPPRSLICSEIIASQNMTRNVTRTDCHIPKKIVMLLWPTKRSLLSISPYGGNTATFRNRANWPIQETPDTGQVSCSALGTVSSLTLAANEATGVDIPRRLAGITNVKTWRRSSFTQQRRLSVSKIENSAATLLVRCSSSRSWFTSKIQWQPQEYEHRHFLDFILLTFP